MLIYVSNAVLVQDLMIFWKKAGHSTVCEVRSGQLAHPVAVIALNSSSVFGRPEVCPQLQYYL